MITSNGAACRAVDALVPARRIDANGTKSRMIMSKPAAEFKQRRERRLRVPRGSFGVTLLDDPDYILLMQTPEGRSAFAVFVGLVIAGKSQRKSGDRGGRLLLPIAASLIRASVDEIIAAGREIHRVCAVNGNRPWLLFDDGEQPAVVVRSFDAWQFDGWGGSRAGSGRKASQGARKNQDDFKLPFNLKSNHCPAVSVPPSGGTTHRPAGDLAGLPAVRTLAPVATIDAERRIWEDTTAMQSLDECSLRAVLRRAIDSAPPTFQERYAKADVADIGGNNVLKNMCLAAFREMYMSENQAEMAAA